MINHDAKVPFGKEAPQDHRKIFNDTSCILKSKMTTVGHNRKQALPKAQRRFVIETIMIHVF